MTVLRSEAAGPPEDSALTDDPVANIEYLQMRRNLTREMIGRLIQRERAEQLARLGGSEPDLEGPACGPASGE